MSVLHDRLSQSLQRIEREDLYRVRRIISGQHGTLISVDGRECLNFCSNDYLGLAGDPRVSQAAQRALQSSGTGSTASALISGYNAEHRALEEELAAFTGYPRALLFSSGWAANCGALKALLGKKDVLIADELNHASLIDGGRLSGARYERIPHANVSAFAEALSRDREPEHPEQLRLLATDAVFSMDGDIAPLPQLAALCAQSDASLMVDDAHGFGVLGEHGRGAVEVQNIKPDIYVATLGKSLGASGAFVAGSEDLIEFLIQRARSWVFSTAPPPAIAAAARCSLQIIQSEPERRSRLQQNVRRLMTGARQLGLLSAQNEQAKPNALVPIVPLIIGDAAQTMAVSRSLFEKGIWVAGIRPPTVPAGSSRLRITLSANHSDEQIDRLLSALSETGLNRAKCLAA